MPAPATTSAGQLGETVEGSPLIALHTSPSFHGYHFIDTEPVRAKQLRELAGDRDDVHIYTDVQQGSSS